MAKLVRSLLKKVSSVSASAAALLAGSSAVGAPVGDPDTTRRTQDALDALKRASGADAAQISFQAGGQVDPQTQEILLAGHTSHSSHASHSSGSYIRGDGPSYSTPSYTPSYSRSSSETTPTATSSSSTPASSTPSAYVSSSAATTSAPAPAPTPAPGPKVKVGYKSGTRLSGSIIQKGSWGMQLLLKDASRIQIPRGKLRAEDISTFDLPDRPDNSAPDVPPMVYLRLKDKTTYTGRVSAVDGGKVTLTADDGTSQTFRRAQMDPDTFTALRGLVPQAAPPAAPVPAGTPAPAAGPAVPAAVGQQVLIKLTSGSKMLVTLLSRSDDEISVRDKDGHEYRLTASRLSKESLTALGMPTPADAMDAAPSPTPKHKKSA